MKAEYEIDSEGVLPTTLKGCRDKEIAPDVWLITEPKYQPNLGKWTALARAYGGLAVVQLRVWIDA